jgi:cytochrome c oxidase subunit III
MTEASDISHVAHQFNDADQQRETATLGMWVFLATEILFFGAIFVAYGVYRLRFEEAFRQGSMDLKWYLGGINTAVLLGSSFFMALGVHASQHGHTDALVRYLWITIALGMLFIGIKGLEYYLEYQEGLLPGPITFHNVKPSEQEENGFVRGFGKFEEWIAPVAKAEHKSDVRPPEERLFMCFYFIMTGIHATHMLIGIGVMLTLIYLAKRGTFSAAYHNPVEMAGLYWHFVDTVWVFLFPIRLGLPDGADRSDAAAGVNLRVCLHQRR